MVTDYEVAAVYIFCQDRIMEKAGYDYWKTKATLEELCNAFIGNSRMWRNVAIPDTGSHDMNRFWVEHVYNYIFNQSHTVDSAGIDYWTNQLDSGASIRETVMRDIITGIAGDDATKTHIAYFLNKVEVSIFAKDYFEYIPDCFPSQFENVSGGFSLKVDHTPESVERAKDKIRNASKGISPCYVTSSSGAVSGGTSGGGGGGTCSSWG